MNKPQTLEELAERTKHYLQKEIVNAEYRIKDQDVRCFNGFPCSHKDAIELNKQHIKFCRMMLKLLGLE